MKKKAYWQLKRMSKADLWNYGISNGSIDSNAQKMGLWYWNKATLLEILSVTHREWATTK